jgi:putative transposase
MNALEPLLPGQFYHVYNRANGFEPLFKTRGNYSFFIQRYHNYISPVAEMYCYCLMPKPFSFLAENEK